MVAFINPQQSKKDESKRLRGERDQIKLIYHRSERAQVVGLRVSYVEERPWWPI